MADAWGDAWGTEGGAWGEAWGGAAESGGGPESIGPQHQRRGRMARAARIIIFFALLLA